MIRKLNGTSTRLTDLSIDNLRNHHRSFGRRVRWTNSCSRPFFNFYLKDASKKLIAPNVNLSNGKILIAKALMEPVAQVMVSICLRAGCTTQFNRSTGQRQALFFRRKKCSAPSNTQIRLPFLSSDLPLLLLQLNFSPALRTQANESICKAGDLGKRIHICYKI